MIIRKAGMNDREGLAKLYIQFWKAHPGRDPIIALKRKPKLKQEIRAAEKDIRKKNLYLFVAEDKGKIIGFIELLIKKNHRMFKVRRYGYINSLAIDRRYRKKGIARKLVKQALKFFMSKNISYARTNIYFSNKTALKAWPRMGFRPESMFMMKKI